jgi:Flp pilus assembly protein TadD
MQEVNDAIAKYQKLLEQYPDNELARFSLAKALYDSGRFVPAKEHFEIALGKKPDWMAVRILLGKCELTLGNRVAARVAFERARQLAIEQDHEGPREEMEQLLAEMG